MPEILPNPFTDPKKLPKRSLFDVKKDEKQSFIDQAMAKGLQAAQESMKKKFSDPELQRIWDEIEVKIENGEIKIHEITIGGKTKEQLIQEIVAEGMKISIEAKEIMESKDFKTSEEGDLELIELSVSDMGLPHGTKIREVFARIKDLGLEVVPAEAGPQFRLQYRKQPSPEGLIIGMEPISDSTGNPRLFTVFRDVHGLRFNSIINDSDKQVTSRSRWVFRRK